MRPNHHIQHVEYQKLYIFKENHWSIEELMILYY